MVKVRKNIVSNSIANQVTYSGTNTKKYIVIHETDNTDKGANADAHGRLQANGNSRQASWHYTVDDKEVVQSFSDNARCWHAGSERYNKNSIGIEICVNSDGDYKKALDNTIELVKSLMEKYNIPKTNVIQHNKASGKNCPRNLRSGAKGVTWSQFIAKLDDKQDDDTDTDVKPKPPVKPSKKDNNKDDDKIAEDGWFGPKTAEKAQKVYGLKIVDGIVSGQPKNGSTRNIPAARFGSSGSDLIYAMQAEFDVPAKYRDRKITEPSMLATNMQKYYGTIVDGKISGPSLVIKEWQKSLNKGKRK